MELKGVQVEKYRGLPILGVFFHFRSRYSLLRDY